MIFTWLHRWWQRRKAQQEAARIHRQLELERGKGWWREPDAFEKGRWDE